MCANKEASVRVWRQLFLGHQAATKREDPLSTGSLCRLNFKGSFVSVVLSINVSLPFVSPADERRATGPRFERDAAAARERDCKDAEYVIHHSVCRWRYIYIWSLVQSKPKNEPKCLNGFTAASRRSGSGSVQQGVRRDCRQAAEEEPGAAETPGEGLSTAAALCARAQSRSAAPERCLTKPAAQHESDVFIDAANTHPCVPSEEHESSLEKSKEEHRQQLEDVRRAEESSGFVSSVTSVVNFENS